MDVTYCPFESLEREKAATEEDFRHYQVFEREGDVILFNNLFVRYRLWLGVTDDYIRFVAAAQF